MKVRRLLTTLLVSSKKSQTQLDYQNDYRRTELSIEIADPELSPFGEKTRFYDTPIKINQNLCCLRHGLGRLEDAIYYLEEALAIGPNSIAGRALIEVSYIKYATCFTDGKTSPNVSGVCKI
ncbi:MAG: hypothetical protein ABJM82_01000 [Shimia thalassica]|uniref:hypothetical protein n=1 Tax=Shimia thalassica TaxID=1715693 RepID=UPI00329978DE